MDLVLGVCVVTLALLFTWGLVAPQSQWRILVGWSVSDEFTNEPGGSGYGIRRLVSGLGLLGLGLVVALAAAPSIASSLQPPAPPRTALETMWGPTEPQLVPRVVTGVTQAPEGLLEVRPLGYQDLDETEVLPPYLLELAPFRLLGRTAVPGLIGTRLDDGISAFASADLLVNVRGPGCAYRARRS